MIRKTKKAVHEMIRDVQNESINQSIMFKNYLNMIYVQVFKCRCVLHYVNSNSHVNVSYRIRLKTQNH